MKYCYYWLKSVGIHCSHYALCLFSLETNSKIKQVPNYSLACEQALGSPKACSQANYSHKYKAEEKNKLKKIQHNSTLYFFIIVSLLSRHATLERKNGCKGDNNLLSCWCLLSPFFYLTTLKTKWYPKLRYNILFTVVRTPWSFYKGPYFTSNIEPLVIRLSDNSFPVS